MTSKKYNQGYYKKNRKKLIRKEKIRRVHKRKTREQAGERLRKVYKTEKKNRHGQSVCRHDREWSRCKECKGGSICEHAARRAVCLVCNPLGWAKRVLRDLQKHAIEKGYKAPILSSEELVRLYQESRICVLCEEPLEAKPSLHHNHETGKVIGFSHTRCNSIEGFLSKLSLLARERFLKNVFSI